LANAEVVNGQFEGYTIESDPSVFPYKRHPMFLFVQSMRTWLARQAPWSNSRQAWRERGSLVLVLVCTLALWRYAGELPLAAQVVLWVLFLLLAAYLLRRNWVQFFGPVLLFEILRAGRRRRQFVFRIVYALLLLTILFFAYVYWFLERRLDLWELIQGASIKATELADFTASFFYIFMGFQFLMIFWLTPAYTAGAITVEKERQTLDALLATDLRNYEIVLSTYVSRLANLLLLLLAGLPILAILQFMGGVDPNLMLAGFAAAGATMVSLAGLGTVNSLFARRPRDAILRTYLAAVLYMLMTGASWLLLLPQLHLSNFPSTEDWTSPVELQDVVEWCSIGNFMAVFGQLVHGINKGGRLDALLPPMLQKYVWFHGLVAVACCVVTVAWFRVKSLEPRESVQAKGRRIKRAGWRRWRLWSGRPGVTARPILWKEMFVDALGRRRLWGRLSSGILLAGVFLPVVHLAFFFGRFWTLGQDDNLAVLLNYWVRGASALIGTAMLLGVAVRAAGCVSGERDRQTLEGIMATPLDNRTIVLEKWLGCNFSQRKTWLTLAAVWIVGYLADGLHLLALPCFVIAWLSYAGFVAGLGMWFSVANRSTLRSVFGTLGSMVLMLLVLLLAAFDIPESWLPGWLHEFWAFILLPPATLGFLTFSPHDVENWLTGKLDLQYTPLILSLEFLCWWSLAAMLVMMANIRFRVVTGRTSGLPNPPCSLSESEAAIVLKTTQTADSDHLLKKKEKNEGQFEEIAAGAWPKRLVNAALLLLPLCLMLAWYLYSHWAAERSLEQAIANVDRLDPGWTFSELEDKRAVIPDEENSSLLIREIHARLPGDWEIARNQKLFEQLQDLDPAKQLNDHQVKILTDVFENNESVLMLARRLAVMSRGRAPITWSKDGLFLMLGDAQDSRTAANILRYDALLRSQENDTDGAVDSCRAIINTGRSVGDEPALISTLVRIAINGVAHGTLERSLAQGQPGEEAMCALQRLLEVEEKEPLLLIGMRGERAWFDGILEKLQNGQTMVKNLGGLFGGGPEVLVVAGSLKGQRAGMLEIMSENVEASKLPLEKQMPEFTRIEQSLHNQPILIRMIVPAMIRIVQASHRNKALLRTDIAALAVERFRRDKGRWPESMAELVPTYLKQVDTDPFDGKPLRYRRNKEGVVIYSVGPDGFDDGGNLDRAKPLSTGTDLGIQLWDPDKRRQPPPPPSPGGTAAEVDDDDQ
jgi:ABC-type transport system involved in multi-copper enzyme maturation permease subunit